MAAAQPLPFWILLFLLNLPTKMRKDMLLPLHIFDMVDMLMHCVSVYINI